MKIKKIISPVIFVLMLTFIPGAKIHAAAGSMLVDKVWTEPEVVEPGQQFKLNITLRNISTRDLEKVAVKLLNMEGKPTLSGFSPVGRTNDMYCEKITKGTTADVSITLMADTQLKSGSYNIMINLSGKEKYADAFEDNRIIGIVVANKPNIIVTDMQINDEDKKGTTKKLKLDFVNAGKGTLSNLMVTMTEGDKKYIKYFGTVEPTDENTYEQSFPINSDVKGKIEITYADELNKAGNVSKDFEVQAPKPEAQKEVIDKTEKKGFLTSVGKFFKRLFGLGG
jgi:hypothetical protein